jgi:hypothetical protein
MDGSDPFVSITLDDLKASGKFGQQLLGAGIAGDKLVIIISFQAGPIGEVGINGCSIEDVIDVLALRLEGFQKGPFQCEENAAALAGLAAAKTALVSRTAKRKEQGVEGTGAPHQS